MDAPIPAPTEKASLRSRMRAIRRELPDQAARSARIWARVTDLAAVRDARHLLVYSAIRGEPDTAPLAAWASAVGKIVALPEDEVDPEWPDVVVVPGVAFTSAGDRLGQGGGWYDRYLARVRPECVTIGVAFAEQIVDALPVEPHDIRLDHVITDQ